MAAGYGQNRTKVVAPSFYSACLVPQMPPMSAETIVFVVDDDAAVRESLTMLLKLSGYRVDAYDSATRFLSEAKPAPGDCLIADIRMPEMDGLELQQELIR